MRHAVIMAGGSGTRLWPISRKAEPKQFQRLVGDQTLIQQTFERINLLIPAENIWVVTDQEYVELTKSQLPQVKPEHVIAEPMGRNTAAATGLATLKILEEDPEAVLFGLLPADHYVGKPEEFIKSVTAIFDFLAEKPEYVATIGIYPTHPDTGLGYIQKGKALGSYNQREITKVRAFHEKPDQKKAEKFLASGQYLWNGGYYLFNAQQMITYYRELAPQILEKLEAYIAKPRAERYAEIPAEPIDKAISEKLTKLAVVATDMEWSDVGNWATLHQILAAQGENPEVVVANHVGNGSNNTLILGGEKLIATVGLKDVVVIDTDDVILICSHDHVQDVKKVVEQLQSEGKHKYL